MTDQLILYQLQQLPESLKLEVADFIGYLLKKHSLPATKPIGKPKKASRKNGGSLKAGLANEEIDEAIKNSKPIKVGFARNLSETINIRLDSKTLAIVKSKAEEKGLGPTQLIRMWIFERINKTNVHLSS